MLCAGGEGGLAIRDVVLLSGINVGGAYHP